MPTIPAYGFILQNKDSCTYYSGDSNVIPDHIVERLKEGNLDIIFQDTCGLDYDGNDHLSFRKLCEVIPKNLRYKVYCIHNDGFLDVENIKAEGFQVPVVYLK